MKRIKKEGFKKEGKTRRRRKKGIFGLKLHCVCGSVIIKYEKENHFLKKMHIDFMNALIE